MSPENRDRFQHIIDGLLQEAESAMWKNKMEAVDLINMASNHIQKAHALFLRAADLLGVEYDELDDTTSNNDNEQ